MFVYDFPLNSKARSYLKFETTFARLQEASKLATQSDTLGIIRGIIDFIDLLDGHGMIKIELGKDLEKLTQKLRVWQDLPEADHVILGELLDQIKESHEALEHFTRQRTVLLNDPIIEAMKPRFLTPCGANCFDTPLFTYWSNLEREEKLEAVNKWLHELDCIRIPLTCIMNIWRICADYQSRIAINGFMQETSETCELIEIKIPKNVRGYPVVSGFQSNINVRFLPYVKGAPVGNITFELAYVRGGIS